MDRTTELESKQICRICLTQDEKAKFIDIFTENLNLQILSVGAVEVIFQIRCH